LFVIAVPPRWPFWPVTALGAAASTTPRSACGFVDGGAADGVCCARGRRPQIHRLNNTTKQPMNEIQATQDSKEAEKEAMTPPGQYR
jgi:hypothetical protein